MVLRLAPLQGVHAALLTPRRPDASEADLAAVFELIDFAGARGVDGILLLGSTGEFVHFDIADRMHLTQLAVKRSRVPVTVNVSHSSLDGALELARGAASCGASGLLLMPPYFFRYSQVEIEEFYLNFAKELGPAAPLLLYNIPTVSNELSLETIAKLLATGLYAGLKDSSGDLEALRKLIVIKREAPFNLMAGSDSIFATAYEDGADGVISGVAGVLPELMVALARAIREGPQQKRLRLEARLLEFLNWCDQFPSPLALRQTAVLRGVKSGPPPVPPSAETRGRLDQFGEWFRGWWPVALKECSGE